MSEPATELDRLNNRFEWQTLPDGSRVRLRSIHADWGSKAANLTAEERASIINRILDKENGTSDGA